VGRFETIIAGVCLGSWLLTGIFLLGPVPGIHGLGPPSALFAFAAALGWLAGNVYVARSKRAALGRCGLLALYLGGPTGMVWLWWAIQPAALRRLAPLAPVLALGVFCVFFLVPVTLRRFPRQR
jgi:hypothetical protein